MVKTPLLIAVAVVAVGAIGLALVFRSVLGSDSVRTAIERQATDALGQPVRVGSAHVSIFPKAGVTLGEVAIGDPAAVTLRQVSVATGLTALFSKRVEGAEIVVADSRIELPLPFRLATGAGTAGRSAPARGDALEEPALAIASIETIAFRNLQLAVGDHSLTIDVESSLTGDRLEIRRIAAASEVTRLEATGVLTSLSKRQGSLDIKGDPLDLDELLNIFSGVARSGESAEGATREQSGAGNRPESPMAVRVNLTAPRGRVSGQEFVDLAATLDVSSTVLSLKPFGVGIFAGRYDGTAVIDLTGDAPTLELDGQVTRVSMAEVVDAAGSPGSMTGTLAADLLVSGAGIDSASMLKAARGKASLAVTDGHIPGLEMVRAVVLAFGRPSGAPPEGSGSAFSRLGGTFALARGVLSSSDITFESRDFDMRATGTVALSSGALDIDADVVLSEELSRQAGTDLVKYTQEKGRVVLPGTITGTLERPRIFVDVKKALGRAVLREAESLIKGLIKKKP